MIARRMLAAVVACAAGLAVNPAFAHHSYAIFDLTKTITISGTLKAFQWSAPHAWIDVLVPAADGGSELWPIECVGPPFMIRAGWSKDMMKPGDKLILDIHPLRTGKLGGACDAITLPSGRKMSLGSFSYPRSPPAASQDGKETLPGK
jgi:hypothetical protein